MIKSLRNLGILTNRDWAVTISIIIAAIAIITAKIPVKSKEISVVEKAEKPVKKQKTFSVSEKKKRFKEIILRPTRKVFLKLQRSYQDVRLQIRKNPDSKYLKNLREKYQVQNNQELLEVLKPHPISLTLAQAAMESAWGTSRFFNQANNVFGIWSFDENEPRIAAKGKRKGETIWVRKYDSIEDSIEHYYYTLAVGQPYAKFRKVKMLTNDSLRLALELDGYSEKGAEYGKELNAIIKYNNFQNFDEKPDPTYK